MVYTHRVGFIDVAERLAARSRRDANGCLIWTGSLDTGGYGVIGRQGRNTKAHRAAWEVAHGPIPSGLLVCHTCDVRACIELTHLWLGTYTDNNRDAAAKGHHRDVSGDLNPSRIYRDRMPRGANHPATLHPERMARGERHGRAKLTEQNVRDIRHRYGNGESPTALAREYRVTYGVIYFAVRRVTWRHVT